MNSKNNDINTLLVGLGFKLYASGNGCHEWHKDTKNGVYQINGIGLSRIESMEDEVVFSEFTSDCVSLYEKTYKSLNDLISQEKRIK